MAAGAAQASATTVDPEEIARFSALAETWWDPDGPFRPLHRLNPVRLAWIRERAGAHFGLDATALRPLDGLDLLDVGCGGGLLCEPMARLGARVTGIDASARNIGIARSHAETAGLAIDYRDMAAEDLAATDAGFDVILNMEVIEHVADVDAFLGACATLLRPGGMMILATLNRTPKSFALAIVGAEYLLRWLPRGTHDWRRFMRPSELVAGLERNRLHVDALAGVGFNPLAGEWSVGRDLSVNYMAAASAPERAAASAGSATFARGAALAGERRS